MEEESCNNGRANTDGVESKLISPARQKSAKFIPLIGR